MRKHLMFLLALPAWPATYHFGAIWDGAKVWKDACITVEAGLIKSVGACSGASIDLSRYTAIPGLIDVHTHLTYVLENRVSQAGRTAAVVYLARDNARKTLETGVTTVRDLGASGYTDIAMRDLINQGRLPGPRMFVAGYGLSVPRGRNRSPGTADGPDEVKRVVREQVDAGADVIKMYGSTGSGRDVSGTQTFTFECMQAACDTAHALGKRIAIHSYGPDGARDAVRAGTDSLEHATDMDDATIAEMVRRKTFYVPTVDHNRLLRGQLSPVELSAGGGGRPERLHPPQPGDRAQGLPRRCAIRDGVGRGLHDVRREYARARVVRAGWHDTRAGAESGHGERRGTAGAGEIARRDSGGDGCGCGRGGRRSVGRYPGGNSEGSVGHEGR